jgi:phosphoglycerate dehydrogenase-like enzyme
MSRVVLIASYLEPEHVERIRAVDQRLDVLYAPDLLRPPQYPADHKGLAIARTPEQEARWRGLLARAEILFDFDHTNASDLAELAPRVRWVQATSAGIGELVRTKGYDRSMPQTIFTTASGVHAQPLAEFCIMVLLTFHKKFLQTIRDQSHKRWRRFAGTDLRGQTLVIVGVGRVGKEIARVAKAFGMRVVGVKRTTSGASAADLHLDELYSTAELQRALAQAQNLVLIAPHTRETERMIGAKELALVPSGAVFINIGRGALVDEPALIDALRGGRLLGAGLDVFQEEPLPPESPLWHMDNVIVSPHSASTSDRENERITDLFCENLRRFLAGQPLMNQLNTDLGF